MLDDGLLLLPDERFSRRSDFAMAMSGTDRLCGEEEDSGRGGSVCAAEARGGRGAGGTAGECASDVVDMAASEPRRVRRGRGSEGDAGAAGAASCRVLLRRNQPVDFFSGVRSLSLSFVDAWDPLGKGNALGGTGEEGTEGTVSCVLFSAVDAVAVDPVVCGRRVLGEVGRGGIAAPCASRAPLRR